MHLGHQPRTEIRAMTLEELFTEVTELLDWVQKYNGNDEET